MKDLYIFFDLDDTLVDIWEGYYIPSGIENYKRFGIDVTKEDFMKGRNYLMNFPIDPQRFWHEYNKHNGLKERSQAIKEGKIRLFPDTHEALSALEKIANLYLFTNTPEDQAKAEIDTFDLAKHFTDISCNNLRDPNKPDPYRGLKMINGRYQPGQEKWFIGDAPDDIATGKAMGARTIFMNWRQKTQIRPDYEARNLTEMVEIIHREANIHLL
ncbi:MAG: HAD family hydrolase [Candidatus Woesearchaeota archaeon]